MTSFLGWPIVLLPEEDHVDEVQWTFDSEIPPESIAASLLTGNDAIPKRSRGCKPFPQVRQRFSDTLSCCPECRAPIGEGRLFEGTRPMLRNIKQMG